MCVAGENVRSELGRNLDLRFLLAIAWLYDRICEIESAQAIFSYEHTESSRFRENDLTGMDFGRRAEKRLRGILGKKGFYIGVNFLSVLLTRNGVIILFKDSGNLRIFMRFMVKLNRSV